MHATDFFGRRCCGAFWMTCEVVGKSFTLCGGSDVAGNDGGWRAAPGGGGPDYANLAQPVPRPGGGEAQR